MDIVHTLIHYFIGLIVSFIGTIPIGPINLTVVSTTLKKGLPAAIQVSIAAAMVEILQSFLAVYCGMMIIESLELYPIFKLSIFTLFIIAGAIFLYKSNQPTSSPPKRFSVKISNFSRGLVVGLLNPQAIPFWVFFLAYMKMTNWIDYEFYHILSLLVGVFTGKFLALYCYGLLSMAVSKRITDITSLMNKVLGSVLIGIGLLQIARHFIL